MTREDPIMERKLIKANGTIYVDRRGRPLRVVETKRLWDEGSSRFGREPFTKPSEYGQMSPASRPRGYTGSQYTGFLVVSVRAHETAESLADLSDLEIPKAGDHVWLAAWKESLPESLTVGVIVSRDIKETLEAREEARAEERVLRQSRETAQRERREAMAQALGRLADQGLTTVQEEAYHTAYWPGTAPRITVPVVDLEAFIARRDQALLDTVVARIDDAYSSDDPKVRGIMDLVRSMLSTPVNQNDDTIGDTRS